MSDRCPLCEYDAEELEANASWALQADRERRQLRAEVDRLRAGIAAHEARCSDRDFGDTVPELRELLAAPEREAELRRIHEEAAATAFSKEVGA